LTPFISNLLLRGHFYGPFLVRESDPSSVASEVTTFWQWLNLLHALTHVLGKRALLLNLDETSVSRAVSNVRGLVVTSKCPIHRWSRRPIAPQPARKRPRRGAMTHICLISDLPDVQRVLPQVFLVNQYTCSVAAAAAASLDNVQVWRQGTAWSTSITMVHLLELLSSRLQPFREQYQPILIMDCDPCHLSSAVVAAATANGIWLVPAPARLTWLLQPLDVCVLRQYKRELQKRYRRLVCDAVGGVVSDAEWLLGITRAAADFLYSRPWRHAFLRTGTTGTQESVSSALKSYGSPPAQGPTAEHLRLLFPRRRNIDLDSFFHPILATCRSRLA